MRNSLIKLLANATSGKHGDSRLLILYYHRVLDEPDPLLPGVIDRGSFDAQMRIVAKCFRPRKLCDAVNELVSNSLPPRTISITFDDGYADNCSVALPVLSKYGVPATFFIATGYLDGGRMWNDTVTESIRQATGRRLAIPGLAEQSISIETTEDRVSAARRVIHHLRELTPEERDRRANAMAEMVGADLPNDLMLSSDQLLSLHRAGMEIGAHTVTHPILCSLAIDQARMEIESSRTRLSQVTGVDIVGFAYPNGRPGVDYDQDHVDIVKRAGFAYAVSTRRGTGASDSDVLQLPRHDPWNQTPFKFGLRAGLQYRMTVESAA